jgi:hypothetical protein
MFGNLFNKAKSFASRSFGSVGDVIRRFGDTVGKSVRTVGAHSHNLTNFVNDFARPYGSVGQTVGGLVNKGISAVGSDTAGRVADKIARFGQSMKDLS